MAHSLEVRAPFLHPELLAYSARLAPGSKLSARGSSKKVLRDLLASDPLLVEFSKRKKHGFAIPVASWLMDPLLSGQVRAAILLQKEVLSEIFADSRFGSFLLEQLDRKQVLYPKLLYNTFVMATWLGQKHVR